MASVVVSRPSFWPFSCGLLTAAQWFSNGPEAAIYEAQAWVTTRVKIRPPKKTPGTGTGNVMTVVMIVIQDLFLIMIDDYWLINVSKNVIFHGRDDCEWLSIIVIVIVAILIIIATN